MANHVQYYMMGKANLYDLIHFVIKQNHAHHQEVLNSQDLDSVIQPLFCEERKYSDPHIFCAMSGKVLCGSIRIFKKTPDLTLPLEDLFRIDVESIAGKGMPIYHIGRFAISKGADVLGFRIFKTLISLALSVADRDEGGVVFAECDVKLLRTIRLLGIEAESIGEPILYLGSETVPVMLPWAGYQHFLKKYSSLPGYKVPFLGNAFSDMNLSP